MRPPMSPRFALLHHGSIFNPPLTSGPPVKVPCLPPPKNGKRQEPGRAATACQPCPSLRPLCAAVHSRCVRTPIAVPQTPMPPADSVRRHPCCRTAWLMSEGARQPGTQTPSSSVHARRLDLTIPNPTTMSRDGTPGWSRCTPSLQESGRQAATLDPVVRGHHIQMSSRHS
jgi:hypothetical protein